MAILEAPDPTGRRFAADMLQDLLASAARQAEQSEPAVRAAAFLHLARVVARTDQAAAEQLLERGIALAQSIDSDESALLLHNAVALAAAVSATHAAPLYAKYGDRKPFGRQIVVLVNNLAQHGHTEDAIAYLRNPLPGDRFPLDFVNNIERECRNDETRRELLQLAIEEWRNPAPRANAHEEDIAASAFTGLFSRFWTLLPRETAASVLTELVDRILQKQPQACEYLLSEHPQDPKLSSDQEFELFKLFPAIQELEPDRARSLLSARPRLAAAIKRFPLAMQSVWEGQRKYDPARDDLVVIGEIELMPIAEALSTDFAAAFQNAIATFAIDADAASPNRAHKECWPSAREFRHILFKAGQHQGPAAAKHLDRIPDPDLRLFAQIELCAALAGLPQLGGLTTQYSRKPGIVSAAELDEMFGPILPGIRCPRCDWEPRTKVLWSCNCGHQWNTFDTRGLCPACGYQWELTKCFQCGEASPHHEWYTGRNGEFG